MSWLTGCVLSVMGIELQTTGALYQKTFVSGALRSFPIGSHDDGPDALEMAVRMAEANSYTASWQYWFGG